jgi:hypothetical protein
LQKDRETKNEKGYLRQKLGIDQIKRNKGELERITLAFLVHEVVEAEEKGKTPGLHKYY